MTSWLHLSDMHINATTSFDQNVIHDALCRDLESQLTKIELDFIFFTGDVAYTASKEDYNLAIAFFNKLCDTISFNKTNLFIIPGNHDVNRYRVSKILDDRRRELQSREDIRHIFEDKTVLDTYLSRFENYSEFISVLYGTSFRMNADNYYFGEIRVVNGTEFGVIGLNSAWASHGGRDDSNNIYIGNAIKQCD